MPQQRKKEHTAKGRYRWLKWMLGLFVFLAMVAAISVGGVVYYFSRDLPSLDLLGSYEPSQATRIYADDNRIIGQFFIEKRVFVPLSKMPKVLVDAILAVEDSRFYEHKGFDLIRMVKATFTNLENMKIRQGASTITQQLARSLFLTPEKTMERKFKEILLARKIEMLIKKDQILEIYLNQIYFGHGAYGVQIAARTYFGKDVGALDLAEAAFLAGLPKAPNTYSPYYHAQKAKLRQQVVLRRMVEEGFIADQQYQEADKEELKFQRLNPDADLARYFLEHVRLYLIARYGDDTVYKNGLNVYTTLNVEMQRQANLAVERGLRDLDKRQGYRGATGTYDGGEKGKVPLRPPGEEIEVGDILDGHVVQVGERFALVEAGGLKGKMIMEDMLWGAKRAKDMAEGEGPAHLEASDIVRVNDLIRVKVQRLSPDKERAYFSLEQEPLLEGAFIALSPSTGSVKAMVGGYDFKRSEFNRALHARRQPGSAFKPMIYATAIERGLTPASVIVDNPIIYADESLDKVWKPENYEEKFYGPIRLREALAHSRNLATVKLLDQVGVGNVIELAKRVGIQSPLTRDLSLALGSSGVSLLELTSAYAVFANQGTRVPPTFITKITRRNGEILEQRRIFPEPVVSKETAYVVTNMLEDVVQRGTGRKAASIGRPIAGKTGTTNEFTDAWFIGFSPHLAAGVWVGFDDNRPMGNKESGSSAALPIWISFMQAALPHFSDVPFPVPENVVHAKIDPETGLLARPEEGGGIMEVFVKGTEPKEFKSEKIAPSDFLKLDSEGNTF